MGQLGIEVPPNESASGFQLNTPTLIPWEYESHPIKTISGGFSHTVALTGTIEFLFSPNAEKGKVVVWGWGASGRLGFTAKLQVKPIICPFFADKTAKTAIAGGQFTLVHIGKFFHKKLNS